MKTKMLLTICLFISISVLSPCMSQDYDCLHDIGEHIDTVQNVSIWASTCRINNGNAHTPKGNLHILIVFANLTNGHSNDMFDHIWPYNGVPYYAALNGAPNDVIDIDPNNPTNRNNLTTWYKTMSNGLFTLTGEIMNVQIGQTTDRQLISNRVSWALMNQHTNKNWALFDNRQNGANYNFDNSLYNSNGTQAKGDKKFDLIYIIVRDTFKVLNAAGSYAVGSGLAFYNTNDSSYYFINNLSAVSLGEVYTHEQFMQYSTHELGHVIFGLRHYMGANFLPGYYFYANKGWGMMSGSGTQENRTFNTTNAWEKWMAGWMNIESRTITTNGIYTIQDFVTQNDAIRIPIPNTNNTQYLWIENHQKINQFDDKMMEKTELPLSKGIYAYVTASGNDCDNVNNMTGDQTVNMFKILSGNGNWDYTSDGKNGDYFNMVKVSENPIAGQTNTTRIRYDMNSDNMIRYCNKTNSRSDCNTGGGNDGDEGIEMNSLNNDVKLYYAGSSGDAFVLNSEISKSGIVPVTNYPEMNWDTKKLIDPYRLNGLSIKVIAYDTTTGQMTLDIKFDDYELRNSKRWTGDVELTNISQNGNTDLRIVNSSTLTIDRSGTPNTTTKQADGFFSFPSVFTVTNAAKIQVDSGSSINVINKSTFKFDNQSTLILKSGSSVTVDASSFIEFNSSYLEIENGAKLIVNGRMRYNSVSIGDFINNGYIELGPDALIEVGANSIYTWSGNGYMRVMANPYTIGKVNLRAIPQAQNASVDISGTWVNGQGFTQKLIEVVSGSLSIDRSISNVSIARGQIYLGENAIVDVEPICYFDNITFDPIQTGNKHGGLWVYGQQNTPYINNCTFNNATTGVTVFPLVNGVGIKNNVPVSTHSKFTNSNFLNCDRAIFVDARGTEIANCYITGTNNHQGILLRGIQYSSFIDQSTSRYHQIGADLIGNYHTETSVKRSSIYNNSTAGIMNRSSKLSLGCDQIYNNASTTNAGYNIWLKPGTRMFAENSLAFGSTYNDLSNQNSASMYLENAFGFNIHNGYNNFNTQNNYGILGQMIPNSVSVSNNPLQWDASTVTTVSNNYWNSMGTSPVLLQDYSIAYNDGWTIYLKYLDDMNQSLGMPPSIIGNCAIGIIGNDPPSPFLGKTMIVDANNIGFDQIYKNALYQRFNGAYADAYNNFKLIAVYNYDTANVLLGGDNIITSEFREWFDVVMLSYSEMMATLYDGFAAGVFDSSFVISNINSQIQQEILNKFEATNESDTTVNYYFVKYQFDFDNCMLNRLVGNYNSAIAGLSQMQNGVHIDANSEMISYYKCLSEKEQYMISATSLDKQELRSIYHCDTLVSTPYFGPPITINQTGLNKLVRASNKMTLFPIPFQNDVNVLFASELNIEDVKIYDVSGRLVFQKTINSKKNNLNLDLNLDNGTYFINVKTDIGTFTEKLIK